MVCTSKVACPDVPKRFLAIVAAKQITAELSLASADFLFGHIFLKYFPLSKALEMNTKPLKQKSNRFHTLLKNGRIDIHGVGKTEITEGLL